MLGTHVVYTLSPDGQSWRANSSWLHLRNAAKRSGALARINIEAIIITYRRDELLPVRLPVQAAA